MICIVCSKETEKISDKWVQPICLSCEESLTESQERHRNAMEIYRMKHAACPKCGELPHSSTLMGYTFNSDDPDSYQDLNNCVCSICGDRHTAHERVPKT